MRGSARVGPQLRPRLDGACGVVYVRLRVRGLICGVVLAAVAVSLLAALGAAPAESAGPAVACTFEQQQARRTALSAYLRTASRARAAYFRAHKERGARARVRQEAADKAPGAARGRGLYGPAAPSELGRQLRAGPCPVSRRRRQPQRSADRTGDAAARERPHRQRAALLRLPGRPGGAATPATLAPILDPEPAWFREVSNGRLAVALTAVPRWIRMPAPLSSYVPFGSNERVSRYVRDAVAAADPTVDFSRYNHFTFLNAGPWPVFGAAILNGFYGGSPASADGVPIRFGVLLPSDSTTVARFRQFWIHEQLHVFGLPDLGGRAIAWDPTSYASGPPDLTHLLGWHKWQLRWIDPPQITCLDAPGVVEETLTPIAVDGGKKLVVARVGETLAYAVEVRRRIGYDRNACDEGVVVYFIDSHVATMTPLSARPFPLRQRDAGCVPDGRRLRGRPR